MSEDTITAMESNTSPEETQERVMQKMRERDERVIEKKNKVLERLKIQYLPVDFLKANAYNPNRQSQKDFDLLCLSMREDGFTQPILAQTDGTIIDGEHRWRAAMHLGYKEVPVVLTDMTAEQMRISTLRHNRARGTEDVDLTSQLLRDLEKLGAIEYAKQQLQLSDDDMAFLLSDAKAADKLASENFGQAWEFISEGEMAKSLDAKSMGGDAAERSATISDSPIQKSYSRAATKVMVDLDRALAGAKSASERRQLKKQYSVFRVVLSVSADEGKVINFVLGKKQSEKFYQICLAEYERMKAAGELSEKELLEESVKEEDGV